MSGPKVCDPVADIRQRQVDRKRQAEKTAELNRRLRAGEVVTVGGVITGDVISTTAEQDIDWLLGEVDHVRAELRQRDEEIAALKRVDEMGIAARNNLRALLGRALAALRMVRGHGMPRGSTLQEQNEIDAILTDADGKAALDERRDHAQPVANALCGRCGMPYDAHDLESMPPKHRALCWLCRRAAGREMSRRRLHQRQRHGRRALWTVETIDGRVWRDGPTYMSCESTRGGRGNDDSHSKERPMKYEIELPGIEELTNKVVEDISNNILHGGDHEIGMRSHIGDLAAEKVAEKIDAEVERIVDDHLAKPIQPTNEVGEPVGEPITFRARIARQVQAWLDEKVDREGRVKAPDYYDNDRRTRAEWAISRAVEDVAAKEIRSAVDKAAREVRAQINGKVTEATAETVKRLLNLKT